MSNTLKFGNGEWYGKEGTILAYNSENNNYKPLPFTFDRASSATRVNKDGLIETVGSGQPRIDYKDDSKGALKLEPSRSNAITNSNFQSGWSVLSGGSITQNQSISPDGTQNAAILSGDGVGANAAYTFINITAQEYTYSMFAKKGSEHILRMIGFSSGANGNVEFNLNNGTIETPSDGTFSNEKIEDYGNGWYRCIVKVTATSSGSKTFGFNREAIVSGNLFSVYGIQLEQGNYATSYIPTSGSAVTRLADACSQTVPDGVIGQTEGSIFIEIDVNSRVLSSSWAFSLNDGTTSNYIGLRRSGGAEFFVHINVSGTTTALIATGITSGKNKISIGYASNNIIVYVNGVNVGTDTSSSIPTTSDLQIGNLISNRTLEDYVSGFKLYNTRLSNSELAALTT